MHQDIICASSEFFRAAVSKEWKEGETKVVRLHEQIPAAFRIYLERLYASEVDLFGLAVNYVGDLVHAEEQLSKSVLNGRLDAYVLCKLWVLGDFLSDSHFKNDVISCLHTSFDNHKVCIGKPALHFILANTSSNSTLQKLCRDWYLPGMTVEMVKEHENILPPSWMAEWLSRYIETSGDKMRKGFRPVLGDVARYLEK